MHVAFLGTGLMGQPLAARLLAQGHRLYVYNRSAAKTAELAAAGARACTTPEEAMQASEWILCMLTDAPAVHATLLSDHGRALLRGRKVVNLATIAPHQARTLAGEVADAGGQYMECPVLGSTPEARAGELILMFGGSEAQFAQARPLLQAFGPEVLHIGEVGKASALKLAMNQLIAALTAAFAASLGLVRREGVDVELFMQVVRASALYAPTYDKKLPRMLARRFEDPNFPVKHLMKDVRLFEDTAARDGLDTRVAAALESILEQAEHEGLSDLDYSALYNVVHPR